jgi:anti-anti-sigma regulatory factor
MEIQRSTQDGCVVVAFTGSIDLFSVAQIQQALLKDLSDRPFALVCDLAGVDILDPVCATVFSTVANHPASRWPDTSFLLCGAQPLVAEILGRLQVKPYPARRTCATSCGWPRPRPLRQRPARSCERSAGTGSSPSPTSP